MIDGTTNTGTQCSAAVGSVGPVNAGAGACTLTAHKCQAGAIVGRHIMLMRSTSGTPQIFELYQVEVDVEPLVYDGT